MERTLVLLKPDCAQRRLVGGLITRFEDKGFNIVAMKMISMTPEMARRHYAEHVSKGWYPPVEAYITSGPLVAMILEGPEAIRVARDMVGATSGLQAAPGTIRGDFSSSQRMNLVHTSDGPESARREIDLFFAPDDIHDHRPTIEPWLGSAEERGGRETAQGERGNGDGGRGAGQR
jgi:nucleoside-diphosphate kinase